MDASWLLLIALGALVIWLLAGRAAVRRKRREPNRETAVPSSMTRSLDGDSLSAGQDDTRGFAPTRIDAPPADSEQAALDDAALREAYAAAEAEHARAVRAAEEQRAAAGREIAAREQAEQARERAEHERAERAAAERAAAERTEREHAARRAADEAAQQQAALQARLRELERQAEEEARLVAEQQAADAARRAAERAAERAAAEAAAAERAAAAARALAAAEVERAAVAARRRTPQQTLVMVVDDSKVVRVKTSRLLARHQFRIALAEDGADALRQISAELPDVLITDVEMPGVDGFELTRRLRADARTAQLPIIMITSADDRLREAAAEAGVTALLGKPYPDEALVAHIEQTANVDLAAGQG